MTPKDEAVTAPYRIWALGCPFNKKGFPVMGTFGSSIRSVIVIDHATWKRLCADIPALQTAQFEVGEYVE